MLPTNTIYLSRTNLAVTLQQHLIQMIALLVRRTNRHLGLTTISHVVYLH